MDTSSSPPDRYHRQTILPGIGPGGQRRLASSRILLVGCGALGTVLAEQLARAGVGFLRIVDRDIVELTNLQRQVLFDESDAAGGLPKAIAAATRLSKINSTITIDPIVADVHSGNIESLACLHPSASASGTGRGEGPAFLPVDLILDGTDNAETRYLINDLAVKHGIPWIYGACVGTEGRVMPILPGRTPCLQCVFPEPPSPGELATCDTAGVLAPAAAVVASFQAAAAIRLLTEEGTKARGHEGTKGGILEEGTKGASCQLITFDLWTAHLRAISLANARREDCPCCARKTYRYLDRAPSDSSLSLCGRNAVQIRPFPPAPLDLDAIASRLQSAGALQRTPYFLRCALTDPPDITLTIFPDGRLLIQGTPDPSRARSLAARFVGA